MTNKAFSLVELLTVVAILAVLVVLALVFYGKYKEGSYITWTKAEMMEIHKLAAVAKEYDGFYHQYLYAMGYRPKGKVFATVGTAADSSTICCSPYPNPGTTPCKTSYRSGFLYYNCVNTALQVATDNIGICDNYPSTSSLACDKESGLTVLANADFATPATCQPNPTTWCDCNHLTVGAKPFFDQNKRLTLNEKKELCIDGSPGSLIN